MQNNTAAKKGGRTKDWRKVAPYALLSAASFICGFGLLLLMLKNAERLIWLGLAGNLYYIVLLPLGLSVAAFLFGIFRSYASYTGKVLNGKLELGGPVVLFALVVLGGFYLPKPGPGEFSVTVFVHGEVGPHDLVLRNSGILWMTLGADLRKENIGDKGQAEFKNIPEKFRGHEVPLSVEADGFELSDSGKKYVLNTDSLSVSVRRKAVRISGTVMDKEGRQVTNVTLRVGGMLTVVDSSGHFSLELSGDQAAGEIRAEATAPGFDTWRSRLVPNGGDAQIQLRQSN